MLRAAWKGSRLSWGDETKIWRQAVISRGVLDLDHVVEWCSWGQGNWGGRNVASWPKRCAKLASKQAMHIHRSLVFLTPHTSLLSLYNQQLAAYTPSPGNGDRVFYETLLEQNPASEMAQKWCVHHGVLGNESPSLHFTSLYFTSLHISALLLSYIISHTSYKLTFIWCDITYVPLFWS